MNPTSYVERRGKIEDYFDRTAVQAWARLTSDAPVGRIRATVRAGRDRMRAIGEIGEAQFPNRQHLQPVIAQHADIDLAAFDILLGDRRRIEALVNERHAFGQLLVRVHDRRLRDAERGIFPKRLHDQRKFQAARTARLLAHREHRKRRRRNAVILQQLLRKILAARQHHPARIAARVRNAQQLQQRHHVLRVQRLAVEFLEHVEDNIRLPVLDGVTDRGQLGLHAQHAHFVTAFAKRRRDVVFRLPDIRFRL